MLDSMGVVDQIYAHAVFGLIVQPGNGVMRSPETLQCQWHRSALQRS